MAGSRLLSPLGRDLLTPARRLGSLGRGDAASPDTHGRSTGDTPGTLGRGDWAGPDHPAYLCRVATSPGFSMMSLPDAEVGPLIRHGHAPPHPRAPHRSRLPPGVETGAIQDPPWIRIACGEESAGVQELRGVDENNPRILEYLASVPGLAHIRYMRLDQKLKKKVWTGKMMSEVDETAWCACFVNWCLGRAKMFAPGTALAKAFAGYGAQMAPDEVKIGAVAVIYKEPKEQSANMTRSGYHVGFYIGGPADSPVLLGGNQSDMVCRKQFKGYQITYRWPSASGPARHRAQRS